MLRGRERRASKYGVGPGKEEGPRWGSEPEGWTYQGSSLGEELGGGLRVRDGPGGGGGQLGPADILG